jgi:transcriptional regulator with XRE-family HTH domain
VPNVTITFDGERFRQVAESFGDKTLEEIAEKTGLDAGLLSRLVTGKRQPSFATAILCADAYKRSASEFAKREVAA